VLFLDEPTNGVDPISRREFWDLLYRLRQQKVLVVISTAYMDEAERCDRVHLLNNGSLVAEGEPRELLSRYSAENFSDLFMKAVEAIHVSR
jgi:ABC-2 type transport system ATP-binding protein